MTLSNGKNINYFRRESVRLKKENEVLPEKMDTKQIHSILNALIREKKIHFQFYNSSLPLELLQLCYNSTNDTVELYFRDIMQERINELKEINEKIQANKKEN